MIVEATILDGHPCIGDTGATDEEGHPKTADCKKDTTPALGPNAHLNEAEDVTLGYLKTPERGATGTDDEKSGEALKTHAACSDESSIVEDATVHGKENPMGHKCFCHAEPTDESLKLNAGKTSCKDSCVSEEKNYVKGQKGRWQITHLRQTATSDPCSRPSSDPP